MIRIYADFNEATEDNKEIILWYKDMALHRMDKTSGEGLGLHVGQVVILYQDLGDLEVEARLEYGFLAAIGRETWFAVPDWTTRRDP